MFCKLVLCAGLLAVVRAQTTTVQTCTANPGPLPLNTYVEGCQQPPCVFPQLEDVVVHIIFRADRTMANLRTLATAYLTIGWITLPVPYDLGPHAMTCNFITNSYCPVLTNEVIQYTLRMHILELFPAGTEAVLEFRVMDGNNQIVFCIRLAIRITPPRSSRKNITAEVVD